MRSRSIALFWACILFSALRVFAQVRPFVTSIRDTSVHGYIFLSTNKSGTDKGINHNLILDSSGNVVYYQLFPKNIVGFDFKVLSNSMMSYYLNGKFYLLDSNFNLVDSIWAYNGYSTDLHELQVTPEGHYLFLAEETVQMDLSQYPWFKDGLAGSDSAKVVSGIIFEVDRKKNVVFEWHAKDHLDFAGVDSFWLFDPVNVDWTHFNAIDVDRDGNLLVSSRHFNQVMKINRSTGDVMWRLGGKDNQFTFLNDTLRFYGQHDIRRLPNGNITLFDNGRYLKSHGARGVEYQLDEVNKTVKKMWSYTYDPAMWSAATGNVQRLPDGKTLVNFGSTNKNTVCLVIVDTSGKRHFELHFSDKLFSYRSYDYYKLPWKLPIPDPGCYDSAGIKYFDAGPGYTDYTWSNGRKERIISLSFPDTLFVDARKGVGYFRSRDLEIADITQPCYPAGINSNNQQQFIKIFPNPVTDNLVISFSDPRQTHLPIRVYDMLGNRLSVTTTYTDSAAAIGCENLKRGIYILAVGDKRIRFVKE